jgi:hypothetical protein
VLGMVADGFVLAGSLPRNAGLSKNTMMRISGGTAVSVEPTDVLAYLAAVFAIVMHLATEAVSWPMRSSPNNLRAIPHTSGATPTEQWAFGVVASVQVVDDRYRPNRHSVAKLAEMRGIALAL